MADSSVLAIAVTGLVGLFGGGSIVSLFRLGPDRTQITVKSAEGALVIQSGVLKDLHNEIQQLRTELTSVRDEVIALRGDNSRLTLENQTMRYRLDQVEGR